MRILLLRDSKGSPDPYHVALKDLGPVTSLPVLSIDFVNLDSLGNLSEHDKNFDGIILTSGNSVKAVKECIDSKTFGNIDEWKKKKCYVVGSATEKAASELGFNCSGAECGNGEALAKYIVKENTGGDDLKTFLFPCGQLKRDILPDLLGDAGINLVTVTVYETTERQDILKSLQKYKSSTTGDVVVVFFSPSGVNFALPKFKEVFGADFAKLNVAAIGKTTAEALEKASCTPCCVAEQPTPEALRSSIETFIGSIS